MQELIRQDLTPAAARAESERRFGSLGEARQRLHTSADRRESRMRIREWLDARPHDLRIALRGLMRSPALMTFGTPAFYVIDAAGRIRFTWADPEQIPRQLAVLGVKQTAQGIR